MTFDLLNRGVKMEPLESSHSWLSLSGGFIGGGVVFLLGGKEVDGREKDDVKLKRVNLWTKDGKIMVGEKVSAFCVCPLHFPSRKDFYMMGKPHLLLLNINFLYYYRKCFIYVVNVLFGINEAGRKETIFCLLQLHIDTA